MPNTDADRLLRQQRRNIIYACPVCAASMVENEEARLRGEMKVLGRLLFEADDVLATVEPENDDEADRLRSLRRNIEAALLGMSL